MTKLHFFFVSCQVPNHSKSDLQKLHFSNVSYSNLIFKPPLYCVFRINFNLLFFQLLQHPCRLSSIWPLTTPKASPKNHVQTTTNIYLNNLKYIVGCRGVTQLGGLVPVPLRIRLVSLFCSLKIPSLDKRKNTC